MLTRRAAIGTLLGTIAAPAVIRTPGLLMPVRTIVPSTVALAYIHNGVRWVPFSAEAEPEVLRMANRNWAFERARHPHVAYPMRRVLSGDPELLNKHVVGDIILFDQPLGVGSVWHQDVRTEQLERSFERMRAGHAHA